MTDYGHDLLFGSFLTPVAQNADRVVALARLSEDAGLDLVSIQDHPYQPAFLDAWTLLSVIAASTQRVRVLPNVANLPLRPPAVLAKSAASLDVLSGGRVELGLGAGAFWDGIAALGGQRLGPGAAVSALEDGIGVIRRMWDVTADAHAGPTPAHPIGIWVGAYKPRMLGLTGRLADGWLPSMGYADPAALAEMNAIIDDAAAEAGRAPSDIRRLYNINPSALEPEKLADLVLGEGMSGFILGSDDPELLRLFGSEIAPAVRELVAAERAGTAAPRRAEPSVATPSLTVVPTPDDGTRRSHIRVWDEADRPTGPAIDPGRVYTAQEQANGRHLVDVHDHLRAELDQVRELVTQVAAGSMDPGAARSHINTLTMRQNNWTLGTYCETYCRVVTTHHTIEDRSMFPHLRRVEPRLAPVIERLEEEHQAIHGVLEQVDQALVALVSGPDGMKQLVEAVDLLTDTLLSHLSYEERELVEPLARFGFQ